MSPKIDGPETRPLRPRTGDDPATIPNVPDAPARPPFVAPVDDRARDRVEDPDGELGHDDAFERRYEMRTKLGEGGMGEVHLCKDRRIGREVALKVIRSEHGARNDLRKRFLREVRVQGQLEHPSVVPVYDLGRDPDRKTYFTMKRVRGLTMEQILSALRRGDPDVARQHTRFKLLTAFGTACLAVHFAHTRGVLHRDLKPGNVMLGDFGEVYVLDWGLAKVTGTREMSEADADASFGSLPESTSPAEAPAGLTATGVLMGTPGYMAPEQIRNELGAMGPGVDIYALGAILFEILALQPLHGKGTPNELMTSTLKGVDVEAAMRRAERDVPPELVAIVARATAPHATNRFATAREMQEGLERFMNGDRDLERRRELAREHAAAAYDAAMRALEGEHTPGQGQRALNEMSLAMSEVSRAIALDPQNGEAMRTLVRLMTEVPRALPPQAQREIDAQARAWQRTGSRAAAFAYLSFTLYAPLGYLMGVRNWPMAILPELLWVVAAVLAFNSSRHPDPKGQTGYSLIVASNLAIASTGWVFGPFMLVPALAAVNALSFVVASDRSRRGPAIFMGCCAILVPLVLEWMGVNVPSYAFEHGRIVILPRALGFPETPTLAFLLITSVALLVTPALFVGKFKDALTATENRLYMQTWHLRQFVPGEAQASIVPPPPGSSSPT
ncbi:MAG: serine/threonine-protein kinase [Polyangiaceae bacterium]